jgi:HD-like signal output (HDOD) protein
VELNLPTNPGEIGFDPDPASLPQRLAQAREAVRLDNALPRVPRVVLNVIDQLCHPGVSTASLVQEIERDPVFAAQVLRLANSPFYAGRRQVGSLYEAVGLIGTSALQTLVLASGITGAFGRLPSVDLRAFWLEAVATGHAARTLARLVDADREAAFLAGLLHGTGHLILCLLHGEKLQPALSSIRRVRGAELVALERAHTGLGHPEVGAAWLDGLGLPEPIVQAVSSQLQPASLDQPGLAALLRLALSMVAALDAGVAVDEAIAQLDARALALFDRQRKRGRAPLGERIVKPLSDWAALEPAFSARRGARAVAGALS